MKLFLKKLVFLREKRALLLLIIAGLLFLGGGGIWLFGKSSKELAVEKSFEPVIVESAIYSHSIEISGNIEPLETADLAFAIAGFIEEIFVEEGQWVESGTLVARLEDSQERYDLAVVEKDIINETIIGSAKGVEVLNLKREITKERLNDTRLYASISGFISEINFDPGDYVRAQTAGEAKDVVVRIINTKVLKADVEVDELDVPYLRAEQPVSFEFDALPDLKVMGEVTKIPIEARVSSNGIAVLDVEVQIPDPQGEILPRFSFVGEIIASEDEPILVLKKEAVMERNGKYSVIKEESGERRPVRVSVADYSSTHYRIISGLELGDEVIASSVTLQSDKNASGGPTSLIPGMTRPGHGRGASSGGGGAR